MITTDRLPHRFTLVRPATATDGYGDTSLNYGAAATRTTNIPGLLMQVTGREVTEARNAQIGTWLLMTNHTDLSGHDRVEWNGDVFEVTGPPELPAGFNGQISHAEAQLRVVEG